MKLWDTSTTDSSVKPQALLHLMLELVLAPLLQLLPDRLDLLLELVVLAIVDRLDQLELLVWMVDQVWIWNLENQEQMALQLN